MPTTVYLEHPTQTTTTTTYVYEARETGTQSGTNSSWGNNSYYAVAVYDSYSVDPDTGRIAMSNPRTVRAVGEPTPVNGWWRAGGTVQYISEITDYRFNKKEDCYEGWFTYTRQLSAVKVAHTNTNTTVDHTRVIRVHTTCHSGDRYEAVPLVE